VRTLLVHRMLFNGWKATGVSDASELQALLRRVTPDLIVLDIGLQQVDGLAVVEDLRARGIAVPVMVLTAFEEPRLSTMARSAGADDLMEKPCDSEQLLQRMERLMVA